jgi:hypothetical protein
MGSLLVKLGHVNVGGHHHDNPLKSIFEKAKRERLRSFNCDNVGLPLANVPVVGLPHGGEGYTARHIAADYRHKSDTRLL